jgi:hypothetical protein
MTRIWGKRALQPHRGPSMSYTQTVQLKRCKRVRIVWSTDSKQMETLAALFGALPFRRVGMSAIAEPPTKATFY